MCLRVRSFEKNGTGAYVTAELKDDRSVISSGCERPE